MEKEGFDYWLTPLRHWLAAAALTCIKRGGHPVKLTTLARMRETALTEFRKLKATTKTEQNT